MEINYNETVPAGKREVFCRFITRNGKRIYPKNARFFHFFVDDDPEAKVNRPQQLSVFDCLD